MPFLKTFIYLALSFVAVPGWAATQTVTLSVPGMTCAACPLTVKKALSKVNGVIDIKVSHKKKQAQVTFDDANSQVEALIEATTNAGYPSVVQE